MKKFLILLISLCALTASAQTDNVRHNKPTTSATKPQPKTTPTKPKPTTPAKPKPQPKPQPVRVSYDANSNCIVFGNNRYKMISVSGGTFEMGATSEQTDPENDEKPVHSVTLSSYMIGETEVTQALWKAVMGTNPSHFKGDNLPVECVSWEDCQDFVYRLSDLTGQRFRLPTEAEWEYAARGGSRSRGMQYSGAYGLDNCGWYDGNSGGKTHPVATKQANELGIYDMSGNVREWCQDWPCSYSSSAQTNPTGPSSGSRRVFRGGGWNGSAWLCRVAYRNYYTPSSRWSYLGLRLAL